MERTKDFLVEYAQLTMNFLLKNFIGNDRNESIFTKRLLGTQLGISFVASTLLSFIAKSSSKGWENPSVLLLGILYIIIICLLYAVTLLVMGYPILHGIAVLWHNYTKDSSLTAPNMSRGLFILVQILIAVASLWKSLVNLWTYKEMELPHKQALIISIGFLLINAQKRLMLSTEAPSRSNIYFYLFEAFIIGSSLVISIATKMDVFIMIACILCAVILAMQVLKTKEVTETSTKVEDNGKVLSICTSVITTIFLGIQLARTLIHKASSTIKNSPPHTSAATVTA